VQLGAEKACAEAEALAGRMAANESLPEMKRPFALNIPQAISSDSATSTQQTTLSLALSLSLVASRLRTREILWRVKLSMQAIEDAQLARVAANSN
jgi:hypothetical protein